MQTQAPWTEIGRIQSDVSSLTSDVRNKADNHEIHSIISRLDSLERTLREISSTVDGFQFRLQELERNQQLEHSLT